MPDALNPLPGNAGRAHLPEFLPIAIASSPKSLPHSSIGVRLVTALLRLLCRTPLPVLHWSGALLGRLVYRLAPRYRALTQENLRSSGLCRDEAQYRQILRAAIREQGRQALELLCLWFLPPKEVCRLVRACEGLEPLNEALAAGPGVILLTPHLGCFEVAAIYAASLFPFTVLYRPAKLPMVERVMTNARVRGREVLAPANTRGVRQIYQALQRGETVGVLPDQAPGLGDGHWATFFGRPAYTMTMVSRLCANLEPAVFLAFARRLPRGEGYHITLRPVTEDLRGDAGVQRMNAALEALIAEAPEQYMWSYNRFKEPAGARPRPITP